MIRTRLRLVTAVMALALLPRTGAAAEAGTPVVREYEARLEEISKEIQEIRRQLEVLVEEVVEGETGRVFIFLEGLAPAFKDAGFTLAIDGKTVLSRALTAGEADALQRGLPVELLETRLSAGEHRVALGPLGPDLPEATPLSAVRGKISSWIAKPEIAGLQWRAE